MQAMSDNDGWVGVVQTETVRKLRKAFVPTMMTAEQASAPPVW